MTSKPYEEKRREEKRKEKQPITAATQKAEFRVPMTCDILTDVRQK